MLFHLIQLNYIYLQEEFKRLNINVFLIIFPNEDVKRLLFNL